MDYEIYKCWRKSTHEVISDRYSIPIDFDIMSTLHGRGWLGDEIINRFCEMINHRRILDSSWPKVFCFNSFFFKRIRDESSKAYGSVQRWTQSPLCFTDDGVWKLEKGKRPPFDLFNIDLVFGNSF